MEGIMRNLPGLLFLVLLCLCFIVWSIGALRKMWREDEARRQEHVKKELASVLLGVVTTIDVLVDRHLIEKEEKRRATELVKIIIRQNAFGVLFKAVSWSNEYLDLMKIFKKTGPKEIHAELLTVNKSVREISRADSDSIVRYAVLNTMSILKNLQTSR